LEDLIAHCETNHAAPIEKYDQSSSLIPSDEVCPQCFSRFSTVEELLAHCESQHYACPDMMPQNSSGISDDELCPQCNARFSTLEQLIAHSDSMHSVPHGMLGQIFPEFPPHWTGFNDRSRYVLIQLEPSSLEYTQIFQQFSLSFPGQKIKSISRVQNKNLFNEYQLYKSTLLEQLGHNGINEMKLFHGTSNDAVDGICTDGFDWRICGKNGTLYGHGSYFARDSRYSSNYSKADAAGERKMFLASVLVGKCAKGTRELVRAPQGFHTVVDDVSSPSIFVAFLMKQAYPEYLITF